jgi:hypothetical protein
VQLAGGVLPRHDEHGHCLERLDRYRQAVDHAGQDLQRAEGDQDAGGVQPGDGDEADDQRQRGTKVAKAAGQLVPVEPQPGPGGGAQEPAPAGFASGLTGRYFSA